MPRPYRRKPKRRVPPRRNRPDDPETLRAVLKWALGKSCFVDVKEVISGKRGPLTANSATYIAIARSLRHAISSGLLVPGPGLDADDLWEGRYESMVKAMPRPKLIFPFQDPANFRKP